jgi:hypothetical protein
MMLVAEKNKLGVIPKSKNFLAYAFYITCAIAAISWSVGLVFSEAHEKACLHSGGTYEANVHLPWNGRCIPKSTVSDYLNSQKSGKPMSSEKSK